MLLHAVDCNVLAPFAWLSSQPCRSDNKRRESELLWAMIAPEGTRNEGAIAPPVSLQRHRHPCLAAFHSEVWTYTDNDHGAGITQHGNLPTSNVLSFMSYWSAILIYKYIVLLTWPTVKYNLSIFRTFPCRSSLASTSSGRTSAPMSAL